MAICGGVLIIPVLLILELMACNSFCAPAISVEDAVRRSSDDRVSIEDANVRQLEMLKQHNNQNMENIENDNNNQMKMPPLQVDYDKEELIEKYPEYDLSRLTNEGGQPEEEIISPLYNLNPKSHDHVTHIPSSNTELTTINHVEYANKQSPKPFHGAARLAFGQHPNGAPDQSVVTSTSTDPTSILSTTLPNDSSDDIPPEAVISGNGMKRSNRRIKDLKTVEMMIKHSDGQYSPFDMAQYVFWTGDESGVAHAVENLIRRGTMTRENAIKFLRDISMEIEYLENTYMNKPNVNVNENNVENNFAINGLQSSNQKMVTKLLPSMIESMQSTNSDLHLNENPKLSKKMKTHSTAEGSMKRDDQIKHNDVLDTEANLEDVIYQLGKIMFSLSLKRGSDQAEASLQELTEFLVRESSSEHITPQLQKKILDILLIALSDTLTEHPDLLQTARLELGQSFNKLPLNQEVKQP